MKLDQSVAIVAGAGSGIGRAIAIRFAAEGARVVVADMVAERAQAAAELLVDGGARAIAVTVDVTHADQIAVMLARTTSAFGPTDILVNNAGLSKGNDILTIDEETWDLNLNVVLKSVFLCSKAVLPGMIERRRGVILNISSVNGLTGVGEEAYAAAKAGMINLTKNVTTPLDASRGFSGNRNQRRG